MENAVSEYKSWSEEYYIMRTRIRESSEKLHVFSDINIDEFRFDEVTKGIERYPGTKYTSITFELDESELASTPVEISKLFDDLGLIAKGRWNPPNTLIKTILKLNTSQNPDQMSLETFEIKYMPLFKERDVFGIELTSSGYLLIKPSTWGMGIHITEGDYVVKGNTERARMLQGVYMKAFRSDAELPHPFIYKILTAGTDWLVDVINNRRIAS